MPSISVSVRAALIVSLVVLMGCRSMQRPPMKSYLNKIDTPDAFACVAVSQEYLKKVLTEKMDTLNHLETAIDAARKADSLQPDMPEALYMLGYGICLKGFFFGMRTRSMKEWVIIKKRFR